MKHACRLCDLPRTSLAVNIRICVRCDTVIQPGGMRVGPPNMPGTRNGWFPAIFGDHK